MIEVKSVIFLIIIHFLADFGLQTHEQATNKSTSNLFLFYHVGVYSLSFFIACWAYIGSFEWSLLFAAITFVCHFLTDFVTSRISKKFFEAKDFHNGFVTVGFDQVIHYIQLLITFSWILTLKK